MAIIFLVISFNSIAENFNSRVIISNLDYPYEIIYGPEDLLWVTERTGKRITRINPINGEKQVLLTIEEIYQVSGQDGLLGMALHPNLLDGTGGNYVYIAYTYLTENGRRLKISRYTYNLESETLNSPVEQISSLSASNDHNAGRLIFSEDNTLYCSISDLDLDGDVDKADLMLMHDFFGQSTADQNNHVDINGDGIINVLDFRQAIRLCSRSSCAEE